MACRRLAALRRSCRAAEGHGRHARERPAAIRDVARAVRKVAGSTRATPFVGACIKAALLHFKYRLDEPPATGNEGGEMTFWSENHQNQFHTAEFLVGSQFQDEIFPRSGRDANGGPVRGREHARRGQPPHPALAGSTAQVRIQRMEFARLLQRRLRAAVQPRGLFTRRSDPRKGGDGPRLAAVRFRAFHLPRQLRGVCRANLLHYQGVRVAAESGRADRSPVRDARRSRRHRKRRRRPLHFVPLSRAGSDSRHRPRPCVAQTAASRSRIARACR